MAKMETASEATTKAFNAQKAVKLSGAQGPAMPTQSQRAAAAVLTAKYR